MTLCTPNNLPEAPPLNTISIRIWGLSFQHMIFCGYSQTRAGRSRSIMVLEAYKPGDWQQVAGLGRKAL
jgi:hypothetical protein